MRKIVLASGSPRRREILERAGIQFVVDPADIEEDMRQKLSPRSLAMRLALGKAATTATRHSNALVIGADTVVAIGEKIWSKPESTKDARAMLQRLSGKTHDVWTAFVIIDTKSGARVARAAKTRVTFRTLSLQDISRYIGTGESADAAGGYKLQGAGHALTSRIEGDFNTVMGLPLDMLLRELKKFTGRSSAAP